MLPPAPPTLVRGLRRATPVAVTHGAIIRILRGLFLGLDWQGMNALDETQGVVFRVRGRDGGPIGPAAREWANCVERRPGKVRSGSVGPARPAEGHVALPAFGHLFRVTTFGESHGPAIGCVIDGCPPGIALTEADIQTDLDRRRPGQSKFVTQRAEPDTARILSGVFQDDRMPAQVTTGAPIALLIENVDQRSKDYADIRDKFRPGHADYTYDAKYGLRDYRGGGRSSARETAARVAAGAVARKILNSLYGDVVIRGALVQMGTKHHCTLRQMGLGGSEADNPFACPSMPRQSVRGRSIS